MKSVPDFSLEIECNKKYIAGCDEAGRGPLCGPVVAAAVIFKNHNNIENMPLISDSKQMSAIQRENAYQWLINNPNVIWGIGQCSSQEIDDINILQASLLAMKRAINALSVSPDFCLIDGNKMPADLQGKAVVKGDAKSISIAAASIIAKQTRDKIMSELAKKFPQYQWDKNMGYPTQQHLQAIEKYGINEHYRKTYRPVKERIDKHDCA